MSTQRNTPRITRQPRRLAAQTASLAATIAVAIAACAKIGEDVLDHETAPFDEPVRTWVLARQTDVGRRFFLVVTNVGSPTVLIPLTGVAAAWLREQRGLPIAGAVVLAPTVALALFIAIKKGYRRARPAGAERLHQRTFAFPSGHATSSAALFGILGYVLWRERMLSGAASAALGTVPTLLIGGSRVYLDVHWATDVLGGWSLGALVAGLSAVVYERVRLDTKRRGAPMLENGD
ncbi:MAG: phosphatase PAP2 family protein [bacterium]